MSAIFLCIEKEQPLPICKTLGKRDASLARQQECRRHVPQNNLRKAIDDYFFDVLRDEKGVDLPVEILDDLELKIMELARARFAA
ncbi:hypothetical protein FVF75_00710 [Maritimibacter fusiformis]|uniref:Uncharacterized protein n=2 Tax=Maritimibacter fusiformis TaxID=2603819 RepID=A0A5D0RRV6_9RHOB|nr:hypothetical protein FVF75_00710 [Maritimibacter fusiformis]